MKSGRQRMQRWGGNGLLGLAVLSCASCCIPLIVPVLGGLFAASGIAGLAVNQAYALAALVLAATAAGLWRWLRQRRASRCACGSGDGDRGLK